MARKGNNEGSNPFGGGDFLKSIPNSPEKEMKLKALMTTINQINKDFGQGTIMTINSSGLGSIPRVSSGILSLDLILGGGYPTGRIIEVFGPESSGKTTIALKAIASSQAEDGICAFIDAEHALDPVYAKNLGVDINELLISQPDNGEMALDIAESLIRSGAISMIVVDSVAALVPKAELDGDMGDAHVGLHARLMSQAMRKLTGIISKTNCIVIFINQIREKVGVMWGNPETTTGGRALKFYASVRLDVRKKDQVKDGSEAIGNKTVVKSVKNKTYPPFKKTEFDIIYGKGPDEVGSIIDFASEREIINKGGAWYTYNGMRFHGKPALVEYFQSPEGKEKLQSIRDEIMQEFNSGNLDLSYMPGESELAENQDTEPESESFSVNTPQNTVGNEDDFIPPPPPIV